MEKKLARQIKKNGNKKYSDYLNQSYTCKLNFQNINEEQFIKLIDDMKPQNSHEFDEISMKLVKTIKFTLI